jgi:hypothetical protein
VIAVEILNPYNEREFLSDKLSIVDVKARDTAGQVYQIAIQLLSHADPPARILSTWADLYSQKFQSGQDDGRFTPMPSGCWVTASWGMIRPLPPLLPGDERGHGHPTVASSS